MQLLSFDIEISNLFTLDKNEDIEKYAPFYVSVAATAIHNGEERIWYSKDDMDRPALNMTQQRAHELLEYLDQMQQQGYMVCAWNGLGFDMKWIGHQADDMTLAAKIALKIHDPMFQFFNQTGFPVALAKVAAGMDIQQKKLMDGADAPRQWHAGNHKQVMDYCRGDCQMSNHVITAIQKYHKVQWITRNNMIKTEPMPKLKTVAEVIKDPDPDQSWMNNPLLKIKFYQWTQDVGGEDT